MANLLHQACAAILLSGAAAAQVAAQVPPQVPACQACHGDVGTGVGRISALASIVPDDSVDFAASSGFSLETVIVEKVRHGNFFAIGGVMPPFSTEVLSDDDLAALIGFLVPAP